MKGYSIVENQTIAPHIKFLRIDPTDLKLTLRNILDSFMNLSWLNNFDREYLKDSYKERAEQSINYIHKKIFNKVDDKITSNAGEYVVSELARLSVVGQYSYLDIPLAELFKKQKVGNPGFDFYSSNNFKHLLFGEAKYIAKKNGYGSALKQISKFYKDKQHITDLADIDNFFCKDTVTNCANNEIGFMVAFSSTKIKTNALIKNIQNNDHFKSLSGFKEIILIAVNI